MMNNAKWKTNTKPLLARVVSLDLGTTKTSRHQQLDQQQQPIERNPLQGSDIYVGGGIYYCSPPNWFYPAQQPPPPLPPVSIEHSHHHAVVYHTHSHPQHLMQHHHQSAYAGAPLTQDLNAARRSVSESSDTTSDNGSSLLAYSPPACITPPTCGYSCDSGGGSGSVSLSDDSLSTCASSSSGSGSATPPSDATSVTSEDSSSVGKGVYCLPRVIKPRKRRKKDRNKHQQTHSVVETIPPIVVQNEIIRKTASEHASGTSRKYTSIARQPVAYRSSKKARESRGKPANCLL